MAYSHIFKASSIVLFTAAAIRASDAGAVDKPGFTATPQELLDAAKNANPGSDHDAVVLLDEDRWVFDKAGDMRHVMRVVAHIQTPQGVQDWSNLEWRWEPWHDKRPVIRLRVITKDGAVHVLDQSTVVDAAAGDRGTNMYSDVRAVKCPLPALAPGAVIEEEIEESSLHLLTGTVRRAYFGRNEPVRLARLRLEYPDSLPLRYTAHLLPDLKTAKAAEGGITRLNFETGPLKPLESSEPLLPPDVPRQPHILFSTGDSWKDLAVEYSRIVEERIANAPVSEIVQKVTAATKDRSQLITQLVRDLHTQVRYTGVEFGDAAIIPAKPADTLKRKYGDCKDKAALLVAMLRAAGVPSHLALLSTGPGQDVSETNPGMGQFDHAIVYVPGAPDLWIDATGEYLGVGVLPAMDQGRRALVVRPETVSLTLIPESPSTASRSVQHREFFLPDFGKSRVVEVNEGTGNSDADLRERYGSADTETLRKDLAKYMRDEYLADSPLKIDHPKAGDFSQPFHLRLEMENATRGNVSESEGAVGIPLGGFFDAMPAFFRTEEKKPNAEDAAKPPKKRTDSFVLNEAFTSEWHYRIHMPPGFQLMKLPDSQNLQWGPAKFTSSFKAEKDLVTADFSFDTGKRVYTADEGAEIKKSLVEFLSKPVLVLHMQPLGRALLTQGKFRESIEQFTAMTKQYPDKAVYRVQLAEALLTAGCGQKAREEAKRATVIDPKSVLAYRNLGFTLLNDLIGRQFGKGADLAGAEVALRKALELDPKDVVSQRNLAIVYEYTPDGKRYTSPERLKEAVKIYRGMDKDDLESNNLRPNLLYDLTYAGQFRDLRSELDKLQLTDLTLAFKLVATTRLESVAAALSQAEKETADERTRGSALRTAGEILLALREYPPAVELLSAGAKGADNPTQVVSRANVFRSVKRIDDYGIKQDSPENFVRSIFAKSLFVSEFTKELADLDANESTFGMSQEDRQKEFEKSRRSVNSMLTNSGMSDKVMLDLMISVIQFKTDPNADSGYRVRMSFPGRSESQSFFVVKQADTWRVLGGPDSPQGVGRRVLQEVKNGNLTVARRWFDWVREDRKITGGDDPLDGPVFPRIWSKGAQGDEAAIRNAAAVLIGDSKHGKDGITLLREFINSAQGEPAKTYAQIAYVDACTQAKLWDDALVVAKPLAEAHPESPRVVHSLMSVYMGLKRWSDVQRLANERLARDPDEVESSRMLANATAFSGKFAEGGELYRKIAESPKGSQSDWNLFGWTSIFAGNMSAATIEGVQKAAISAPSPATLHTLATMYAEAGKSTEARETVLAAMRLWGLDEPNSEAWLVFGRLAEQYGVTEEAVAAYQKVVAEGEDIALSSHSMAKKRLAGLRK